jgi:F-type H+-transporting ATPase subunit b
MQLDGWTIALQTVNFAILVWLLHRFLYRPVLRLIDQRQAELRRQYAAAQAAEDAAKAEATRIAEARAAIAAEREAALKSAAAEAQQAAEARRTQAEREAQTLIDGARKTLASERERALAEARAAAVDLGAAFAQRLLAEMPAELRAEAWLERIEQHVAALPEGERATLMRQLADGTPLTVVTAAALSPATAMAWRGRLAQALGAGVAVRFAADQALIAGAELHFPTAVLRFSWQDALASLRSESGLHGDAR